MKEEDISLEEEANKTLEENKKEFKAHRNIGIGLLVTSAVMLIPTVIAYSKGYDLQKIDTSFEMIATLTAMTAVFPFVYGALAYSIGAGGLDYIRNQEDHHSSKN